MRALALEPPGSPLLTRFWREAFPALPPGWAGRALPSPDACESRDGTKQGQSRLEPPTQAGAHQASSP